MNCYVVDFVGVNIISVVSVELNIIFVGVNNICRGEYYTWRGEYYICWGEYYICCGAYYICRGAYYMVGRVRYGNTPALKTGTRPGGGTKAILHF